MVWRLRAVPWSSAIDCLNVDLYPSLMFNRTVNAYLHVQRVIMADPIGHFEMSLLNRSVGFSKEQSLISWILILVELQFIGQGYGEKRVRARMSYGINTNCRASNDDTWDR